MSEQSKQAQMAQVGQALENLTGSSLYEYRKAHGYHAVLGEGNPDADLLFIGDAAHVMSPVGGYKMSGYGRENGVPSVYDYLQLKSVWLGTSPVADPFPDARP